MKYFQCDSCKGTGKIETYMCTCSNLIESKLHINPCPICFGNGKLDYDIKKILKD